MRKIRKIVACALATMMMMAMSITAFAVEDSAIVATTEKATIKVTNISYRDESTTVSIYPLALVDTATNTVEVLDWAAAVYPKDSEGNLLADEFDATALSTQLNLAIRGGLVDKAADDVVSTKGSVVSFSVPAGVYVVRATGDKVRYSTMVAKAYAVNTNGTYTVPTSEVTVVAKGDNNTVDKTNQDGLVKAGQVVDFEITSTVPYNKSEYKIYDKAKNLSAPTNVVVKVGGTTLPNAAFDTGVVKDDGFTLYTMDLTSLVQKDGKADNSYAGLTVTITYQATVKGAEGYVNATYDSTNGSYDAPVTTIQGFTGDITLTKLSADEKNEDGTAKVLSGAEFTVTKDGSTDNLRFVKVSDGVYRLAEADDNATVDNETVVATNGTVKLTGLDEGSYHFTETKAPANYSINTAGADATIENLSDDLKNKNVITDAQRAQISVSEDLTDTKLVSLPFTGGMGTTIFTVLGVAIMVLAAALYFVSKRRAAR